jgi:hypothetical protein
MAMGHLLSKPQHSQPVTHLSITTHIPQAHIETQLFTIYIYYLSLSVFCGMAGEFGLPLGDCDRGLLLCLLEEEEEEEEEDPPKL